MRDPDTETLRGEARMPSFSAERDPEGFDHRIFKCDKCGVSRTVKAPDPMKSTSAGWLAGELKPPT